MLDIFVVVFFFFKQKTAYEMLRSLVGSEMCIRDRLGIQLLDAFRAEAVAEFRIRAAADVLLDLVPVTPVSYTHLTLPTIYSV